MNTSLSAPAAKPSEEKRRVHWFRLAVSLVVLHVAIAVQLIPVIGFFVAIYLLFPPMIFFVAYDTASDGPLFAVIALGTSLLVCLGLRSAWQASMSRWPRLAKWLALATLAIWIPLGCGEAIRWTLMQTSIANAHTECYGTSTLLASLRQRYSLGFEGYLEPHAWMIRNGEVWLWSYRSLRFEPVPNGYRTSGLIEACAR
jgi:hypothetical protein